MAAKLVFSTNIREAAFLIEEGEVAPFLDHKDTRYVIEIDRRRGMLIWTPFHIPSEELMGTVSYVYPFASHNMIFDAIFGPRSKDSPQDAIITEWPDFPVEDADVGSVVP